MTSFTTGADRQLQLTLDAELISAFYPLLQQGVRLPVATGCSVMELLHDQLGIAEVYVLDRITTLFLDGRPVDNLTSSVVDNGSVLALSAAMPGLVGTTMRRGGHLGAMREAISYHPPQTATTGSGVVKIKLFNIPMKELGPLLLERGVVLTGSDLMTLLADGGAMFQNGCDSVTLNGRSCQCAEFTEQLPTFVAPQQTALVRVKWNEAVSQRAGDLSAGGAS
ncbi:MAG: hypothetical protein R6V33_01350 [Pelovirga sp.]